ncbi:hypothetical protein K469DRAFT_650191 [Zopfia rhizophila CBS 207.26]|uniref:Zn(2)-C6 fungal-type domain-containing protein n=1 Tax=Zopfia rhizophila CBS 207.26 TaxID=1314779 RepID=A0A6A6ES70_9PEZI|nr:hypothetical protein K469DRAFT_650191 [Zopfia rhizophila CBS 207.26]
MDFTIEQPSPSVIAALTGSNSDPSLGTRRARKRRAVNACAACRTSKVKCDGSRPCQRCTRSNVHCQYHDGVKDATALRLDRLEAEVLAVKASLDASTGSNSFPPYPSIIPLGRSNHSTWNSLAPSMPPLAPKSLFSSHVSKCNAAENGLVTWQQASFWFQSFFSGSHYLVPIFCEKTDTFQSVSVRSAFLFDTIISVGCRAEEGPSSSTYRRLQSRLREHFTSIVINPQFTPCIETIQALAVMASYSENGSVLIAVSLRLALELGLPKAVERLTARMPTSAEGVTDEEKESYRLTRVWYCICNLELFFSLDGGKAPGIDLSTSSRRIRALVHHPEKTSVDLRLLSQVELNIIRSNAYNQIVNQRGPSFLPENETILRSTVCDTSAELSLWLEEWSTIISAKTFHDETSLALLNLKIQFEWAIMTLHLKAVSDPGIENVVLMTDFQRDMVRVSKEAAIRHLQHLLQASSSPPLRTTPPNRGPHSEEQQTGQPSTYLSTFKWTTDYVWAKCAFSVLLVLKLTLLLRDPPSELNTLLRDSHNVLEELKKTTVGHVTYFRILQISIEKCEGALKEYMTQQPGTSANPSGTGTASSSAESDFQEYTPSEFVFEWKFPGLNLRYMPLGWQDLFDFDSVF